MKLRGGFSYFVYIPLAPLCEVIFNGNSYS